MERKPEVPASNRDEALFHFVKPSGVPRGPSTGEGIGYPLQYSWASLVAQTVKAQICLSSVTDPCCCEMTPHFTQGRSLSHPDGLQCDPGLCTPCPHCCLLLSLYLLHFSQAHSLLGALVLSVPMAGRALPPRHLLDQLLLFSVVPTSTLCPEGRDGP